MRFTLQEPRMVAEARQQTRLKRNLSRPAELIIETLVFILVFLVSGLVLQGLITALAMIPLLISNEDFFNLVQSATASGQGAPDFATAMGLSEKILQSPAMTAVELFATLGTIIGVIIYCRAIEGRKLATLGLRRGRILREYFVGMLIGAALFSLVVLVCVISGTLTYEGLAYGSIGLLVLFFLGFMVQGMSEELLCRGYFMVSLARKQSLVVAVIVSSSFFGALHLFNAGVQLLAVVNVILFGCFAAVYLLKRGNIWGAAAIHSVWNFVQGNVFGVQVSGLDMPTSVFSFKATADGALINGGAFGPEGGLATTIVLTAALIIALLLKTKDPAPQVLATEAGDTQVVVMPGAQPLPSTVMQPLPFPPGTQPPPTTAWPPPPDEPPQP
jgi:membrane protease YdiL (CAAX protease family)